MTSLERLAGVVDGLAIKAPCAVATTANIVLGGLQEIDGVSLTDAVRVLVKDQDDATENGIYLASSGNWLRTADFDGARDVTNGTLVNVYSGASQVGEYQVYSTDARILIGESEIELIRRTAAVDTLTLRTVADLQNTRMPASALAVQTLGYYAAGDGGGALYVQVSAEPGHPGKVQSLDGAWWELSPDSASPNALGARGDVQIIGMGSALTIALGSKVLTVVNGRFKAADLGKFIKVPGAGAAGVALHSTIAAYISATQVMLEDAALTALAGVTASVKYGSDDSAPFNNWATVLRYFQTRADPSGWSQPGIRSVVLPRHYLIRDNKIDMTGLNGEATHFMAVGAVLHGFCAGEPVIDAIGTRFWNVWGLTIVGDELETPTLGIQHGRRADNLVADHMTFRGTTLRGHFSLVSIAILQSEASVYDCCTFENNYAGVANAGKPCVLLDSANMLGLTTDLSGGISSTPISFVGPQFRNCRIATHQGNGIGPAVIINSQTGSAGMIRDVGFHDGYYNANNPTGGVFEVNGSTMNLMISGRNEVAGDIRNIVRFNTDTEAVSHRGLSIREYILAPTNGMIGATSASHQCQIVAGRLAAYQKQGGGGFFDGASITYQGEIFATGDADADLPLVDFSGISALRGAVYAFTTRARVQLPATRSVVLYCSDGIFVDPPLPLGSGGTGQALIDPGADRMLFWDESNDKMDWLTAGRGLLIAGTSLTMRAFGAISAALTPTGADATFTGIAVGWDELTLACDGISHDSGGTQSFIIELSSDNGSTWPHSVVATQALAGSTVRSLVAVIRNYSSTDVTVPKIVSVAGYDKATPTVGQGACGIFPSTSAINAIRIRPSGGNFDAGTVYLLGR